MPVGTGSRRWFAYVADNGTEYNVELDESNGESEDLGFGPIVQGADTLEVSGRRPLRMRYVNCQRNEAGPPNETVRRRFYVGTVEAYNDAIAAGVINVSGLDYGITTAVGERRVTAPAFDTGRLDGDIDDN